MMSTIQADAKVSIAVFFVSAKFRKSMTRESELDSIFFECVPLLIGCHLSPPF